MVQICRLNALCSKLRELSCSWKLIGMKRTYIVLLVAGLGLGSLIFVRGEAMVLTWLSRAVAPRTLADLSTQIGPAIHVVVPEGQGKGPFPVLILMHGCGGVRPDHDANWAALAAGMGFVAVVVDSNGPRGYTWQTAQSTICEGNALLGQERAGDILVGLRKSQETGMADSDAVFLVGWSHGAWAVMDFMTMGPDQLPAGLSAYDRPWPTVRGVVLYYPYCGPGALSRVRSWKAKPPVLALMGAKDQTVDTAACVEILEQMKAGGLSAEIVIYPEANHSFDYAGRNPEKPWLRPDDAADAKTRVTNFLAVQVAR
jgi:dienelactone hydrolase